MNPYARFGIISNFVSAAVLVAGLTVFGGPVFEAIKATTGASGPAMWAAVGVGVVVMVVFWQAMTEAIFPTLFRFNMVRRLVLGKYYAEGTWLQAERGANGGNRMSVIDIQPDGKSFIFSGYALNEDLEIESNTLIELSKYDWPFMTYKFRNSLSDGSNGERDGVGEIQFEMNRSSAQRYNGFVQNVAGGARVKIEGNKLTSNTEVKRLRTLDGRHKVFEKYWELFFNRTVSVAAANQRPAMQPVIEDTSFTERRDPFRSAPQDAPVVARRRASDWRQDDVAGKSDAEHKAELDSIVDEIKATGSDS